MFAFSREGLAKVQDCATHARCRVELAWRACHTTHRPRTLQHLGQQKAAETALRKAIQLKPGHAISHFNLAVVYATQKPPFTALAKFHYNKAVQAGHQEDEALKNRIDGGN